MAQTNKNDGANVNDDKIKAHLTEVAGFTPCDKWAHIIDQLRKGKTYYVNRTNGKLKIKVIGDEIQAPALWRFRALD